MLCYPYSYLLLQIIIFAFMFIINRPQTDPYFNIASEEYLLKILDKDCFILWQNEPSVIVGKHQNTLAEINYQFVKKNKIPVIRRISGGGTVFHDPGNLNFSFIRTGRKEKLVDFKRFTLPIIDVLQSLGVDSKFEGKNDIKVNGLKISGNAEHVYKNKVLHHGTLLFSSQLDFLNKVLKVKPDRFQSKAIQSVRSEVANISDFLTKKITIREFREKIIKHISGIHQNVEFYSLTENDIDLINQLVTEKYKTWKWNFGYSPKYSFETELPFPKKPVKVKIYVEKGIIRSIESPKEQEHIVSKLIGVEHDYNCLQIILKSVESLLENNGMNQKDLLKAFF
ncbi:MAG: lipoate--protein ligase [Bacteroidales bacterium]|nr:lipoate--protein ligase [Bacteroidales bacterium]